MFDHHMHRYVRGSTAFGNMFHHKVIQQKLNPPGGTIHGHYIGHFLPKVGGNIVVGGGGALMREGTKAFNHSKVRHSKGPKGKKDLINKTIEDVNERLRLHGSGDYSHRPAMYPLNMSPPDVKDFTTNQPTKKKGKGKEKGKGLVFESGRGLIFDHEMSDSSQRKHLPKLKLSSKDFVGNGLSFY